MSEELKNRTKKFALDIIGLCTSWRHTLGNAARYQPGDPFIELGRGQLPVRVSWKVEG